VIQAEELFCSYHEKLVTEEQVKELTDAIDPTVAMHSQSKVFRKVLHKVKEFIATQDTADA
jgi:hypothetical protein